MELSQYTCMVKVHGYLRIDGDLSAAELAPLCHLRVVDHWLAIQNNTLLTELSFFLEPSRPTSSRCATCPRWARWPG